jgi:hypothetical protein
LALDILDFLGILSKNCPVDLAKGDEIMPSQRDVLRELVASFGMNEEKVIQEHAAAEKRSEAKRASNKHDLEPEAYARALWRDGIRKGWLK